MVKKQNVQEKREFKDTSEIEISKNNPLSYQQLDDFNDAEDLD